MKFDKNWLDKKWVAYTIATCSAVVVYLLLSHINLLFVGIATLYNFISPVFMGLVVAYVMNPLAKFFKRTLFKKMKSLKLAHNLSVMVTTLVVIFLVVIISVAVIPQLVKSTMTLFNNLDSYATSLEKLLNSADKTAANNDLDISDVTNFGNKILNAITASIPDNMSNIINTSYNIGMSVVNGVIAFIMAIYFLADKERLLIGFKRLMHAIIPEKRYKESADFWSRCNDILSRYIVCELLDGLIVGAANCVFMSITGMPYMLLISVVVGVTNLAPTFGPIVGGVIGAFILVLVNPWYALWFIIFTIILQTCDGYVIKPKLFGSSLGVSSVWILVSIIVGGRMFGVIGVLLAIPFAAIFDYVYKEMIWKKLNKHKAEVQDNAVQGTENKT